MSTVDSGVVVEERAATAPSQVVSRRAWLIWAVAALCYFVALFHRASLGVAAPEALDRFSAGPALLSVFSALQLGVYLVLQVPAGLLADRLGPRTVITGGVLALGVGSLIFAISASVLGGVTGRMLIGFGDAFLFINVLRLAAEWFPVGLFGRVAALTGLCGGLGQVVSTLPLSAALHSWGWVPTFASAAAGTVCLALVAWVVIRDRPVGVERTGTVAEPVRVVLREVVHQRGTKHSFWVHFALMAQFVAVTALWGAPWLTHAQGMGTDQASGMLLVCVAAFVVGSWLCGQYVAGRGLRRERCALWSSVAVAVAWLVVVAWPGVLPTPLLVAVLLVVGAGGGCSMLAFDGARAWNAAHRSGTATGVVNMGGFIAAVLIQLSVGAVLQASAGLAEVAAYRWAFVPVLVLVVIALCGQLRFRTARESLR